MVRPGCPTHPSSSKPLICAAKRVGNSDASKRSMFCTPLTPSSSLHREKQQCNGASSVQHHSGRGAVGCRAAAKWNGLLGPQQHGQHGFFNGLVRSPIAANCGTAYAAAQCDAPALPLLPLLVNLPNPYPTLLQHSLLVELVRVVAKHSAAANASDDNALGRVPGGRGPDSDSCKQAAQELSYCPSLGLQRLLLLVCNLLLRWTRCHSCFPKSSCTRVKEPCAAAQLQDAASCHDLLTPARGASGPAWTASERWTLGQLHDCEIQRERTQLLLL